MQSKGVLLYADGGGQNGPTVLTVNSGGVLAVSIVDTTSNPIVAAIPNADALVPATLSALVAMNFNYGYDGAKFDRVRIANVFNSGDVATAGNHAIWTPAAGKSFRLMGYTLSICGTAAALVSDLIQLLDGVAGTVFGTHRAAVATAAIAGDTQIFVDYGQGRLSGAANNILQLNIATALASGGVSYNVWGTEE